MANLHVKIFGDGPPVIFIHGLFSWGLDTFPEQRVLADDYRVMLVDRRGFGESAWLESDGWPTDMHDIAGLLDEVGAAHLVGHSYGAVVALLAAGIRSERVLSLVAIEPMAFELARGDPDADASVAALKPVYERAHELTTREFVVEWGRARGMSEERLAEWTETVEEREAEASRRERWPGDAPIDIDELRAAPFPKLLARGAWKPEIGGRERGGRDFAATARVLAERIEAQIIVFDQSAHSPQLEEPEAFNRVLLDLWSSVGLRP